MALEYYSPSAERRNVVPLAWASFCCLLPTFSLVIYLSFARSFYVWQVNAYSLIGRGCALIGILLAIKVCRHRRWALGCTALSLNAFTLVAMTPHFTSAAMGIGSSV